MEFRPSGGNRNNLAAHRSIALKLGRLKDWGARAASSGNASLIAHISSLFCVIVIIFVMDACLLLLFDLVFQN